VVVDEASMVDTAVVRLWRSPDAPVQVVLQ